MDLLSSDHQATKMPSSDEDSISRWSQFLGHRDVSRPERPSSLDVQSIDTAIHVDSSHEQPATSPKQPRLSLRRKKGRIFDQGFLGAFRKLSGNKSPSSSSDPEDAPNSPRIVPPLHDTSDPERYSIRHPNDVGNGSPAVGTSSKAVGSAFKRDMVLVDPGCALTPHEKFLEIAELVQVRTASAGVTLQRVAELGYEIDGQERQGLLTIARSAADVALREYSRVCRTRPKAPLVHMLERNAEVPLLGVNDCREYIVMTLRATDDLVCRATLLHTLSGVAHLQVT